MPINKNKIESDRNLFYFPVVKINYFFIFILSVFIWLVCVFVSQFCPHFLNGKFSFDTTNFYVFYINNLFDKSTSSINLMTILSLIFTILVIFCQLLFFYYTICSFALAWKYDKWLKLTINNDTKIISSCQHMQFDDKIAMLVPTFNDFSPNTIIQTANQTYKNIDVWILNDSEDVNLTNQIKEFCNKHKFYFLQHDSYHKQQHPTKIGNIYYFLKKYGNKYDYIFENDSSSIVNSSFVYNSLCFFHSPLLNHEKDACVVPNSCFYGINNLMSYLAGKTTTWYTSGIINNSLTTNKCLTGYDIITYGCCCLTKTSVLQKIPLNKIETTTCDTMRGYWLSLNNYKIYYNPFDFGAKIATQSIWAMKNQRHKWIMSDIFAYRKSKFTAFKTKYNNKHTNYIIKITTLQFLITPIIFVINLFNSIFRFLFYLVIIDNGQISQWFNYTSFILSLSINFFIILCLVIITLFKCKKQVFTYASIIINFVIEFALSIKRCFFIIFRFFTNNFDWDKIRVTTAKKRNIYPFSQKIKQILLDIVIILILFTICIIVQLIYINKLKPNEVVSILSLNLWFFVFIPLILPFIIYICFRLIGDIKIKKGYDFNMKEYKFWHNDFRFKIINDSWVWKQQNLDKH